MDLKILATPQVVAQMRVRVINILRYKVGDIVFVMIRIIRLQRIMEKQMNIDVGPIDVGVGIQKLYI